MYQVFKDLLAKGATIAIVSIIGTSDRTTVIQISGGLDMHPIFLSITNIFGRVHMNAMLHACYVQLSY